MPSLNTAKHATSGKAGTASIQGAITVVTVTYGERWDLVRQVVDHAISACEVGRVIVVDNASAYDVAQRMAETFGSVKISVLTNPKNLGSAVGFNQGIAEALEGRGEFLFLLDDDNVPEQGCEQRLLEAYAHYPQNTALAAYRPTIQRETLVLQGIERIEIRENSFAGFDISEFVPRLVRKLKERSTKSRPLTDAQPIAVAPYGGFFADFSLIKKIGLPKKEYVLYGDDHEYTYRVKKAGGQIWLRSDCVVIDVDQSWGTQENVHHYFIQEAPLRKLHLTVKNVARFEAEQGFGGWRYKLNRTVFLGLHALKAAKFYRDIRYALSRRREIIGYVEQGRREAKN